jgi:hypothetical protein
MDHAEALERLDAAFTGPGKLRSIETDRSDEGAALRRHIAGCAACLAEVRALQLTALALSAATPDTMRAPVPARARVLATVAADGVSRGLEAQGEPVAAAPMLTLATGTGSSTDRQAPVDASAPQPLRPARRNRVHVPRPLRVGLALAAAVVLFVGGALAAGPLGITPTPQGARDLVAIVAASDLILQQSDHVQVALYRPDGQPGGAALFDPATRQIVVTSETLGPAGNPRYSCYLLRDGNRTWLGPMFQWSGTTYWAGTVKAVSDLGRPGDVIEVRLQGSTDTAPVSGAF